MQGGEFQRRLASGILLHILAKNHLPQRKTEIKAFHLVNESSVLTLWQVFFLTMRALSYISIFVKDKQS
jgi:hypothetical protein